ncbi:helix-turn-helix domain-containing protein [bacterium]|nr:helix-turn-helix domain-containing protein [bacterium]
MPKNNLMYLGSRIRTKRKERGLTQQVLADQCGLAVKTIQDIEKGRKNPSYETLSLLIDRLGISPDSLFPANAAPEDELTQHVMGKLRLCNEENQRILLRTMDFLAEELLISQPKTEPDGSE